MIYDSNRFWQIYDNPPNDLIYILKGMYATNLEDSTMFLEMRDRLRHIFKYGSSTLKLLVGVVPIEELEDFLLNHPPSNQIERVYYTLLLGKNFMWPSDFTTVSDVLVVLFGMYDIPRYEELIEHPNCDLILFMVGLERYPVNNVNTKSAVRSRKNIFIDALNKRRDELQEYRTLHGIKENDV